MLTLHFEKNCIMINKFALYICGIAVVVAALTSCNDSNDYDIEYTFSSTKVTAFSLKENKKILNNLDTVFFSIDLVEAQIFNADSLPYGTNVTKLQVNISTESCSTVELHIPRPGQSDTIVNYLKNSTDSINFANGPVRLHLVSLDHKAERDYTIRVNVHQIEPDSLYWDRMARTSLPASLPGLKAQKTVYFRSGAACLEQGSNGYKLSFNANPAESDSWQIDDVSFGFTPVVRSFTACDDNLFILSTDNTLYTSEDLGATWQSTGMSMSHIYGAYESYLLGVVKEGSDYYHVTYPASTKTAVPANCPVANTGALAFTSSKWSSRQQCFFVGGTLADGSRTNTTWGFDGNTWAMLSDNLPVKASNMSMFAYKVSSTDTISWVTKEYPCLIAFGGIKDDNSINRKVFISRDYGLNWKQADDLLQLPAYLPDMYDADPLVFEATISDSDRSGAPSRAKSDNNWTYFEPVSLPAYVSPQKAVKPITEWQCPYIFLFGGHNAFGDLFNTVWRGVINRLTFKPLQ